MAFEAKTGSELLERNYTVKKQTTLEIIECISWRPPGSLPAHCGKFLVTRHGEVYAVLTKEFT